jgi:RNA-directed DNA polymerase
VRSKISDRGVLELIEHFLNQSILEELREWTPETGVPQGAVLAPPTILLTTAVSWID